MTGTHAAPAVIGVLGAISWAFAILRAIAMGVSRGPCDLREALNALRASRGLPSPMRILSHS